MLVVWLHDAHVAVCTSCQLASPNAACQVSIVAQCSMPTYHMYRASCTGKFYDVALNAILLTRGKVQVGQCSLNSMQRHVAEQGEMGGLDAPGVVDGVVG